MPGFWELWKGATKSRTTSLLVPLSTFWFYILVSQLTLPLEATYAFLGMFTFVLLIGGSIITGKRLLDIEGYQYRRAAAPILFGVGLAGAFMLLIMALLGNFTPAPGDVGEKLRLFSEQVLLVAVVEELYFRWAVPNLLPYGPLVSPFFFAISHPVVREAFVAGGILAAPVLGAFVFFAASGFLLQALVFLGQHEWRGRRFFGLAMATGAHGTYNTIIILFTLQILGVSMGAF